MKDAAGAARERLAAVSSRWVLGGEPLPCAAYQEPALPRLLDDDLRNPGCLVQGLDGGGNQLAELSLLVKKGMHRPHLPRLFGARGMIGAQLLQAMLFHTGQLPVRMRPDELGELVVLSAGPFGPFCFMSQHRAYPNGPSFS